MVALKTLRLQNFQTHLDTTLEFNPNFNCIIGSSRSGKSSITRALDFLFYNDWDASYLRFGSTEAVITAVLSNGIIVVRTKGEGINKVVLKDTAGKEATWQDFGINLPREVADIFSVFLVEADADNFLKVNIADQDDRLFLLYPAGNSKVAVSSLRTKVLSRLAGLHWIDYALKDLNKDKKDRSSQSQVLEVANETLKKNLQEFTNLSSFEASLTTAKNSLAKIKQLYLLSQQVDALISKTTKWKEDYRKLQEVKKSITSVNRFEKAVALYETYQKLASLATKVDNNEYSSKNIQSHRETLSILQTSLDSQLEAEILSNPICADCGSVIDPVKFKELSHARV